MCLEHWKNGDHDITNIFNCFFHQNIIDDSSSRKVWRKHFFLLFECSTYDLINMLSIFLCEQSRDICRIFSLPPYIEVWQYLLFIFPNFQIENFIKDIRQEFPFTIHIPNGILSITSFEGWKVWSWTHFSYFLKQIFLCWWHWLCKGCKYGGGWHLHSIHINEHWEEKKKHVKSTSINFLDKY